MEVTYIFKNELQAEEFERMVANVFTGKFLIKKLEDSEDGEAEFFSVNQIGQFCKDEIYLLAH